MTRLVKITFVACMSALAVFVGLGLGSQSPFKCIGVNVVMRIIETVALLMAVKTLSASKVIMSADGKKSYASNGTTKKTPYNKVSDSSGFEHSASSGLNAPSSVAVPDSGPGE
jgi:hypothetical protein